MGWQKNYSKQAQKWSSSVFLHITILVLVLTITGGHNLSTAEAAGTDTTAPSLVKAEPTSKQLVYLTFNEPIEDPITSGSTITISGGLGIAQIIQTSDARIVRLVLNANQGTGNQYPAVLAYTVTVQNIKDLANNNLTSAAQSFDAFTPHGKYAPQPVTSGNANRICGQCHSAHNGQSSKLLAAATVKQLCFVCHGTIATSVYSVEPEFTGQPGPYANSLHKSLDDASYNYLTCTDCHNPHGEKQTGNELYPKLLRSTDSSGTKYVQGNQFCLACHGKDDQGYENSSYYNLTGGNHINPLDPTNINAAKTPGPAHYDNISFPLLNPASGTQITCTQCHESHGSKFGKLLDNNASNSEEQLCLKCHNTTNTSMNGRNIQSEFSLTGSTHDLLGAQSSKLECTSCHGPHTVAKADISAGGTTSQVSDPDNTKKFLAPTAGTNTNAGDLSDFCLRCHDGNPPTATTTFNQVVPFTINFPAANFSNNNGGWNKSTYKAAGHYTGGQLNCASCHASHGSAYPSLLKYAEDTDTVNGVCLRCHGGATGSPAGAKNVKPDLTKTGSPSPDRYRHPTLYISGKHSNTENYNNLPLTSRHAECTDCHDPHAGQNTTTTAPNAPGSLTNVSGIQIDWGTTTWDTWSTNPPTVTFVNSITNQYQLCLKCHSSYSWGTTPPQPGGSIAQTDTAKEFNPNNPSFHAVTAPSKTNYGLYVAPMTKTSRLYCEDCHSSNSSGIKGPHGSSYWYILKAPWTRNTVAEGIGGTGGQNTQNHLCFSCHDYNFYASGQNEGSSTQRSAFSGSGKSNLHAKHKERGCTSCHSNVPHGWKKRSLLTETGDPAPYNDGSWLEITTWQNQGSWSQNSCNHNSLRYGPKAGQSCG